MNHVWLPSTISPKYILLQGYTAALVRTEPSPDGYYLWQFRKIVGYAGSVQIAKDYVEAGSEFFQQFRRNPYA